MKIKANEVILFQGDSITDCSRSRQHTQGLNPDALGYGYPYLISAQLSARYPGFNLSFINRGISGNRVRDLRARWEEDCINLRPDWLSILIGINDTWRRYKEDPARVDTTTPQAFEHDYRQMIQRAKQANPDVKLIMMEPFVLPTPADRLTWREDLDPKIAIVRALAREFSALLVPLDGLINAACTQVAPEYWAQDGVHPTPAGHSLIAQAWMDAIQA